MIYCEAVNEAASRREWSSGFINVPCDNPATYFVMNRKGHILCAVCGNHKGETIKFRKRGTFTCWGFRVFDAGWLRMVPGLMRP